MTQRVLRADAQRSRERLLAAAREVFLRDGADGSLEEIARRAGVGSATLHRHFSSRWELIDAVFIDMMTVLRVQAEADPGAESAVVTLTGWLQAVRASFARVRGLAAAVLHAVGADDHPVCRQCNRILVDAGAPLLRRAIDAGEVRADVSIEDLLALASAAALMADGGRGGGERLLTLALQGVGPQ